MAWEDGVRHLLLHARALVRGAEELAEDEDVAYEIFDIYRRIDYIIERISKIEERDGRE
ncbi:MAG: hypothetical protein ABGW50_08835 [Thermococcus sp.]